MELNRDQIVKALEYCISEATGCIGCPYSYDEKNGDCVDLNMQYALSLIKQLTEENEKLKSENKTLEIYNKDYKFKNIELLKFNRRWAKECAELQDECDQIKEKTILKMQNKILALSTYGTINISSWQLEQIVKELLEINK